MKKTKSWVSLTVIFLFLSFIYIGSRVKTTEVVQIMEINKNNILVHNIGGKVTRVYYDTEEIKSIIDKESYYVISYRYSIIERPKLIKIKFYKKID